MSGRCSRCILVVFQAAGAVVGDDVVRTIGPFESHDIVPDGVGDLTGAVLVDEDCHVDLVSIIDAGVANEVSDAVLGWNEIITNDDD